MDAKNVMFTLKLNDLKPHCMSIARVGEYLTEFAGLLGKDSSAKFGGVNSGSVVMEALAPETIAQRLIARLRSTGDADASKDLLACAKRIDQMMQEDGTDGSILLYDGSTLLYFQGKNAEPETLDPEYVITEHGELTGCVTRIGGRDETVPLLIKDVDGAFYDASVKGKTLAREIGQHLFGAPLRFYGMGTWKRTSSGTWHLQRFVVESFETLDHSTAEELLTDLAKIPGNGWNNVNDPIGHWLEIRGSN